MSRERVVGILLAGGRGSRLGLGRPKALAEVAGATLLERALAILAAYAPAALDPLAVRLRAGERALVPAVRSLGPRLVMDDEIAGFEGGHENFLNVNTPDDLARAAGLLVLRAPATRP